MTKLLQSDRLRLLGASRFDPLRDWFKALYEVLAGRQPGTAFRRIYRTLRC